MSEEKPIAKTVVVSGTGQNSDSFVANTVPLVPGESREQGIHGTKRVIPYGFEPKKPSPAAAAGARAAKTQPIVVALAPSKERPVTVNLTVSPKISIKGESAPIDSGPPTSAPTAPKGMIGFTPRAALAAEVQAEDQARKEKPTQTKA